MTFCNPREGNPYGTYYIKPTADAPASALQLGSAAQSLQLAPTLPMLPPLPVKHLPAVFPSCNSCGHATHLSRDRPHLWMTDSNTSHSVPWASSEMGRWWASHGHYVYGPDPIPNYRRFRISTPGQISSFSHLNSRSKIDRC